MPDLISTFLQSPITNVAGRVVLTLLFWSAGLFGLFNFPTIVKEMRAVALPLPVAFAALTIAVQLIGSILLITNVNQWGWLGAGALGVFTLMTIPFGHAFWTFSEPRRSQELYIALEHVALVGGLLLAAVLTLQHA